MKDRMLKLSKVVLVMLMMGLFLNLCGPLAWVQAANYRVTNIEVKELPEEIQVLITSDGPPNPKVFGLEDPSRVRIFLPGGILTLKEKRMVFKERLIKRIEASQYDTKPNIVKIDIYLAYTTDFEIVSDQNLVTLSIAKRVKPTSEEVAREARRHYKLGRRYYKREEFAKAILEFGAALDFNPKLTRANNFIFKAKEAIRERERKIVLARKRVEKEIRKEAVQKAREEREEKIRKHYVQGKRYYRKGELSQAIGEFMVVYTLDPKHRRVSKYIARIQDKLTHSAEEKIKEEAISKMRVEAKPVRTALPEKVEEEVAKKVEEEAPEEVREEVPEKSGEVPTRVTGEAIYQVRKIQVKELPEEIQIIIVTDQEVEYSSFTLSDPFRLVIDIPQAILVWEGKRLIVEKGGIYRIRTGQFSIEPPITRIVIDLTREVEYKIGKEQNLILVHIKRPPGEVERTAVVEAKEELRKARLSVSGEGEYIIQEGDILQISVWQFDELSRKVTVRPGGRISYPLAGDLQASGLTPPQLAEEIAKRLTRFVKDPQITVDLAEFAQKKVFIMGEVGRKGEPGTAGIYRWRGELRVLGAIMMAKGLAPGADYGRVNVTTKEGKVIPVDLNKLLFQGDVSQNILLHSEDIIYVPSTPTSRKKRVFIMGEVKKPGRYYIESKQRLVEALMESGGYTKDAVIRSIAVIRGDLNNPQVHLVNLKRVFRKGEIERNIELQSGDIIYVPRRFIVSVNYFINAFLPALQSAYYLDTLGLIDIRPSGSGLPDFR